jgi:hypothetical protein
MPLSTLNLSRSFCNSLPPRDIWFSAETGSAVLATEARALEVQLNLIRGIACGARAPVRHKLLARENDLGNDTFFSESETMSAHLSAISQVDIQKLRSHHSNIVLSIYSLGLANSCSNCRLLAYILLTTDTLEVNSR